jgi:hypothetical protein
MLTAIYHSKSRPPPGRQCKSNKTARIFFCLPQNRCLRFAKLGKISGIFLSDLHQRISRVRPPSYALTKAEAAPTDHLNCYQSLIIALPGGYCSMPGSVREPVFGLTA